MVGAGKKWMIRKSPALAVTILENPFFTVLPSGTFFLF